MARARAALAAGSVLNFLAFSRTTVLGGSPVPSVSQNGEPPFLNSTRNIGYYGIKSNKFSKSSGVFASINPLT